ncbi:MAG: DUF3110 domain-containing protein [Synechococcus sp. SB0668_bin_15]|nr:DUF3110 domain-containing protein [Synechococcus sp. SB0668_bin_15]MXZ82269.1 DUF3110 domain-containing protein [Synechococcus sp. SB0666_bin_14]MYA91153.1 DUF3110 domain-containing protein [Synechococcus sp. SB0663_bin_10]MYC48939.1 DUF3110 domain-containing protein [Synechococcus sp. SB0662_bin_14]MYG46823.1 DUF3110 domain-containing protein [Synechococcus sp. SB0675_bin_6]MYJ59638.1 DUF3110 domain-containing protein [Synechococcus sp. SB0672_bin_6]MYK91104.1 DUF3110 domain-containing pr
MGVHVLLFDAGTHGEGIHSIDLKGKTIVLLFEDADDAERYAELLEAQDFPSPTVETIAREEVEYFCRCNGYEARIVPQGFRPRSEEDRLLLLPPERNLDVENWHHQPEPQGEESESAPDAVQAETTRDHGASDVDPDLDDVRRKLERLL